MCFSPGSKAVVALVKPLRPFLNTQARKRVIAWISFLINYKDEFGLRYFKC